MSTSTNSLILVPLSMIYLDPTMRILVKHMDLDGYSFLYSGRFPMSTEKLDVCLKQPAATCPPIVVHAKQIFTAKRFAAEGKKAYKYAIVNGFHRVLAAIVRGDREIPAKIN